jgi:hypothetical protein
MDGEVSLPSKAVLSTCREEENEEQLAVDIPSDAAEEVAQG